MSGAVTVFVAAITLARGALRGVSLQRVPDLPVAALLAVQPEARFVAGRFTMKLSAVVCRPRLAS